MHRKKLDSGITIVFCHVKFSHQIQGCAEEQVHCATQTHRLNIQQTHIFIKNAKQVLKLRHRETTGFQQVDPHVKLCPSS